MTDVPEALEIPEADRLEGVPHPRDTLRIYGQEAAERAFLDARANGRGHHAWLITGPRGVGKATLAWRIARFLLTRETDPSLFGGASDPATSLDTEPEDAVIRRIAARAEPRLLAIARAWDPDRKRLKAVITVDEIRKLNGFFGLSAPDGGHRVVIIDSADEMNTNAANALLKSLEEPPENVTLLLVAHQPARLLPTIRSRCSLLRCTTLGPTDLASALKDAGIEPGGDAAAVAELAGGSPGAAIELLSAGGLEVYSSIAGLLSGCPNLDREAALAFADIPLSRDGAARIDQTLRLLDVALARMARTGAGLTPSADAALGERGTFARLAPDAGAGRTWAALQQEQSDRAAHARAVNLDPSSLILDMVLRINDTAADILSRR